MDTGKRVAMLRKKLGLSQDKLAEMVGYSERSSIAKIESGNVDLPASKIKALAKALNTTEVYLMALEDDGMYNKASIPYRYIPLYGPICCGNGGFNDDNILEYIPVPSAGLADHKDYFCQYAVGDSMIEKIEEGDLLVFEKCSIPEINGIGCFCIDENTSTCKKYVISGGIHMLMPLNSKYDPIVVDSLAFRCIGNLKKIIRSV